MGIMHAKFLTAIIQLLSSSKMLYNKYIKIYTICNNNKVGQFWKKKVFFWKVFE
jgi:hypothetical protein